MTAATPAQPAEPPWPGRPFPLGATWDGRGTNFALWSSSAEAVSVCLFDGAGRESRIRLADRTYHVWHGYLPGVRPGQLYGFRTEGTYEPRRGQFHNPAKLLVDPYARAIMGDFTDHPAAYGGNSDDSAPYVPRSAVVDGAFSWGRERHPDVPWDDTVIY